MGGIALVGAALLAVLVAVVVAVVVVRWRKRDRSPAAEYRRNVSSIRLDTYRQITPGYTRQVGTPFESGGGGAGGL
jgi:hypothetical protein